MGEADVTKANDDEAKQVFVSSNPNSGVFFRSQNGATWTPSEREDLKFTLFRANFLESTGNVNFYNPELDTGLVSLIPILPLGVMVNLSPRWSALVDVNILMLPRLAS